MCVYIYVYVHGCARVCELCNYLFLYEENVFLQNIQELINKLTLLLIEKINVTYEYIQHVSVVCARCACAQGVAS